MPVKQILLAEDDKDDQFFFVDFLKDRKDFILLPIAENGVEVMNALCADAMTALPDIIILDQNMPKQNGLQTLQLLKSNDTYKHIPVIVYSTYASEQLLDRAIESGAVTVISKPSTFEGYNKMMDDILGVM